VQAHSRVLPLMMMLKRRIMREGGEEETIERRKVG
jgi:hypothetical protein